jgi:Tol biopolymer transport system component
VVFCSERQGNPDLFVLDLLNPGPARPLTEALSMEDAPAVSPDGKSIVFVSTRDGNADIFIMPFRPDGPPAEKEAVNLTRHPGGDFNPAFSPLGDRISFVSDREGDFEIYTLEIGSDGQPGELRRVTDSPGHDMHPKFSPDGKWIVFALFLCSSVSHSLEDSDNASRDCQERSPPDS